MNTDDLLWYALFAALQVPFMAMGFKFNVYVFFGILVMAVIHLTLLSD